MKSNYMNPHTLALQEKWVLIADRDSVFFDCAIVDISLTFR